MDIVHVHEVLGGECQDETLSSSINTLKLKRDKCPWDTE